MHSVSIICEHRVAGSNRLYAQTAPSSLPSVGAFVRARRHRNMDDANPVTHPQLVIILSGKRKSGKDFVADLLDKHIADKVLLRISYPIKKQFTEAHGLSFEESLTASSYKESFRLQMLKWSEEVRRNDPNVFLRAAIADSQAERFAVWILVDARRTCDLSFFRSFPCRLVTVRITATDETRVRRGWNWTAGVDDVESECGLDGVTEWDVVIQNDDQSEEQLLQKLDPLIRLAAGCCSHQRQQNE